MNIKALLILGLCFHLIDNYILLKGQTIPKNYEIGLINHMEYLGDDKLYFKSTDDVMGIINASTGALITVFELEDDENILEHRGSQFVIIEKNRDMNLLIPKQQSYVKLKYSEYLEKQNFKKIITFKRFSHHDYILTNQFLAKAQHTLIMGGPAGNHTQSEKFSVLYRKQNQNQVFFKMIGKIDVVPIVGIVLFRQEGDKKQMCFVEILMMQDKFNKKICTTIDKTMKIYDIREVGPGFQVRTQESNIIYNQKLQFIEEIPFMDIATYYSQLNRALDKNKNGTNQLKQNTQIRNFAPPDELIINVYQRYILARKGDNILANIEKSPKDMPVYHWSYTRYHDSSKSGLVIQYQDGRVISYEVDEKAKSYIQLWRFSTNPIDKKLEGQLRKPKQSNLQAEQDLEKVQKQEDIQIKGKDSNNNL